ncbi:MAG: lipopolysaccharide biosynthesis protein RfbH [Candidatus Margulisiibacteriota bacterium]|jgi:CDP-6-deoxy-D-xylo-4-hexulose-3-dehydrase
MINIGDIVEFQFENNLKQLGLVFDLENGLAKLALLDLEKSVIGLFDLPFMADDLEAQKLAGAIISVANQVSLASSKLSVIDKLKKDKLAEFFRLLTKNAAYLYYKNVEAKKDQRSYLPAAGKVLDELDLFNMIDASLDMWLTTGRFNDEFEQKLAAFLNAKYVITTNSGSSANLLALTALTSHKLKEKRLQPGDEVITVAAGFPTTIVPIIQNNLVPVFVDVELGTYNIAIEQIEAAITTKTKAIFIAHTLGNPFDLGGILEIVKKHNLWLIEDNCDSLGSKYNNKFTGTFGHIGTLSFYPAHHMTMGEGGALITNDPQLNQIILSIRDWGRDCFCPSGKDDTCKKRFKLQLGKLPFGYDHKYTYSHLGYNLKITDWQAALGISQLAKLPGFIKKRQENFMLLKNGLQDLEKWLILPQSLADSVPSWFGFMITVKEDAPFTKQQLVEYLEANQIGTRNLFAGNILRQPVFIDNHYPLKIGGSELLFSDLLTEAHFELLPNSEMIMNNTFWIGLWPGLGSKEIDYILEKIKNFSLVG